MKCAEFCFPDVPSKPKRHFNRKPIQTVCTKTSITDIDIEAKIILDLLKLKKFLIVCPGSDDHGIKKCSRHYDNDEFITIGL